jgi:23S rRNA (guanosine2251-2'-O)-methyltransferase
LYVLDNAKGLDAILKAAVKVPCEARPRYELDQLAGGVQHQGVVLEADPLPLFNPRDWMAQREPGSGVVVVLDGVEDPHNFGAIVRSAAACGAEAVVFGRDRAAPISSTSIKTAAGAMEYVDLVEAPNLVRAIETLKEGGFWAAALDPDGPQMIWEADLKGQTALVIGSEGKGIRKLVHKSCDLFLRIPLTGPITSLNASVSAAIALAECLRQRSV